MQARVLLIGAEDEENLALRTLAAVLRERGVAARLVGFSREGDTPAVLRAAARWRPDVVAISMAFQRLAPLFMDLVADLRAQGFRGHVVVGGHFPTFEYAEILAAAPGIDSVARFEGEHSLPALVAAVTTGASLETVPNLVWRTPEGLRENPLRHAFPDLDAAPFPVRLSRPLVRLGERFATLIASRGCWHASCAYCCIGAFHRDKGERFVLRSAEKVAEELAALYHGSGVRLFQFHDDNFVLPTPAATRDRLRDLRRALERQRVDLREVAFLIKARPDVVDTEVAAELAELGCVGVFLGIENASDSGQRSLMRAASLRAIDEALAAILSQGMSVTYNLLIFHPHATLAEIRENMAFVRRHPEMAFDFGRAEIVAGSPLEQLVIREGRRRGVWPHWDYEMADATVERLFEINLRTFRRPGSAFSGLMHTLIALSYHADVLVRLHPGPAADRLREAARDLIARANLAVIDCLERACNLATAASADEVAVAALDGDLQEQCQGFQYECNSLTNRMLRLQAAERVFSRFRLRAKVQERAGLLRLFDCDPLSSSSAAALEATLPRADCGQSGGREPGGQDREAGT